MNRRIYGTEIEYGSLIKGKNGSWSEVSSNHDATIQKVLKRIRGKDLLNACVNSHLMQFTENGARVYTDLTHIEYATPECSSPQEVIAAELAGGRLLAKHFSTFQKNAQLVLIKENIGFGEENLTNYIPIPQPRLRYIYDTQKALVSFGYHENYSLNTEKLLERLGITVSDKPQHLPEDKLVIVLCDIIPFLITRQILAGSGTFIFGPFHISARPPFIDKVSGASTTHDRSIINTRLEHHGIIQRLHMIIGDANRAEVASLLKLGTTGLVLSLLEDGLIGRESGIRLDLEEDPVSLLKNLSKDTSCFAKIIRMGNGEMISSWEMQKRFFALTARHYPREGSPGWVQRNTEEILYWWEYVLHRIETGRTQELVGILDWPTKMTLGEVVLKKYNLTLNDLPHGILSHPRKKEIANNLRSLEQRYHELSNDGYYARLKRKRIMRVIIPEDATRRLMQYPPEKTRAHGRGFIMRWVKRRRNTIRLFEVRWDLIRIRFRGKDGSFSGIKPKELLLKMEDPFVPLTLPMKRFSGYNNSVNQSRRRMHGH